MTTSVDPAIAAKVAEIKAQPYAKFVTNEDAIQRNFGYKIVRQQVASGRNSLIYKAEAPKFHELYCVVKAYKLGKEKVYSSFKEETCQIMRFVGTRCAQLISTHDIFYTNDKIYIICDWSPRGDVLNAIKSRQVRLNESLLRLWTLDMMSAISYLHQNAICHRNVAPSCLLLIGDNRIKLTGLSDATIYCKPDGSLIKQKWTRFSRTANWNQPPEVAKNKLYDPRRADVWSLGATIYWFITRSYPIDYKSSSRMTRQLEHRMRFMRKVSSKCQAFVKKLLSFQPAERPTIGGALELSWLAAVSQNANAASEQPMASAEPTLVPDTKAEASGEASGPEDSAAIAAAAVAMAGSGQAETLPPHEQQASNNQDGSQQPPDDGQASNQQ